jgi:hypothetical protein
MDALGECIVSIKQAFDERTGGQAWLPSTGIPSLLSSLGLPLECVGAVHANLTALQTPSDRRHGGATLGFSSMLIAIAACPAAVRHLRTKSDAAAAAAATLTSVARLGAQAASGSDGKYPEGEEAGGKKDKAAKAKKDKGKDKVKDKDKDKGKKVKKDKGKDKDKDGGSTVERREGSGDEGKRGDSPALDPPALLRDVAAGAASPRGRSPRPSAGGPSLSGTTTPRGTSAMASSLLAAVGTAVPSKGDRVLAKYRGRGKWFPGVISAVLGSGPDALYDVQYDDGDKDSGLEAQHVRREDVVVAAAAASSSSAAVVGGGGTPSAKSALLSDVGSPPSSRPSSSSTAGSSGSSTSGTMSKGDRVLAKYRGRGKWFPGVISAVLGSGPDALYDVQYDDGDKDSGLEAQHVRREDVVAAAAAASSASASATAVGAGGTPSAKSALLSDVGGGASSGRDREPGGILRGSLGDVDLGGSAGRRSVTFAADVKPPAEKK